jgi:nucleoside-diphosphate-sugar epimerase
LARIFLVGFMGSGKSTLGKELAKVLDFTFVDDTAMGIVLAATSENSVNKTYNISRGKSHTLLSAATLVTKIVGKGSVIINNRDMSYPVRGQLSILQAKKDLGYRPAVDLEEGLVKYYEWLKQVKL